MLEDYVNTTGSREPKAYKNLCELYNETGSAGYDEIVAVALKGLKNTDEKLESRAALANLLASVTQAAGNEDLFEYAIIERFRSKPSLINFIPVIETGKPDVVANSIINLDSYQRSIDNLGSSHLYEDYFVIHFLNKDYDMVFDAFNKDRKSLGWSSSLKRITIPLFIGLLTGFNEEAVTIKKMIVEKVPEIADFYKLLKVNVGAVTPEQDRIWRERCIKEAENRIDAIVSEKHRGSYSKAAQLLVAISEMILFRDEAEPLKLLEKYKERYLRYTAFRGEVRAVLSKTNIMGIKF
jgi:hypothetical protein